MADDTAGGRVDPHRIPLSAIFLAGGPVPAERRASVISRVLSEFPGLPVAARNALRSAVNDQIIPTTGGFRRGQAGRALDRSSFLLQEPLVQAIADSEVLAAAVLLCWAESHPSLREAVERQLTGRGLSTPGLNLPERLFRGYWPVDQWEVERKAFSQTYEEDFNDDDVALMLCYVSGNFPLSPDLDGLEDGGEDSLLVALSAALSAMRQLPATSREWERQIPDFVASVSNLIEAKTAELQWHQEFDAVLQSLRDQHGGLLRFFEQDTLEWTAARVSENADAATTLKLASRLQSQLAEYSPIHNMAPGISEEQERIQTRALLQPAILDSLQAIDSLMTGVAPVPSLVDQFQPTVPFEQISTPGAELAEDSDDVPRGSVEGTDTTETQQPFGPGPLPAAASQEARSLPYPASSTSQPATDSTAVAPVAAYTALESENQDLRDEVEALKTELFGSQEREDSWRLAYRSAVDGSLQEVGAPSPVVESVNDAVEMAKSRFRQELVFAPNSDSNIEDNPFTDPEKVWDAFRWLATIYYSSKMGRLRITDFDQSIKEACGWWYKGDQGESTVSRYRDSYSTRVEGKRYTLVEHIGKGTTFDARYTIRIAFDWDRERRQVVIGYIGRHQQTDAS